MVEPLNEDMKISTLFIIAATAVLSSASATQKAESGLPPSGGVKNSALGALPFIQIPDASYDVRVLRMNLPVGRHRSFTGLDVGLIANIVDGTESGLAFAFGCNMAGDADGLVQLSMLFNNVDNPSAGIQLSCVNLAGDDYDGVQVGAVNMSGRLSGLQLGLYNWAEGAYGVQIGLLNVAGELRGMQLGLLNIASESSVPVLPILHLGF